MIFPLKRVRTAFALLTALALMFSVALSPLAGFAQPRDYDQLDGQTWTDFDIQDEVMPDVTMAAGALIADDGRILWSRNLDERRPMASITKIMTAILAIEHLDPEKEYFTMPAMPLRAYESRAHLREGDILTREQLLQSLMMVSGNDAAIAIALEVADDVPSFVVMMNERAEELGMSNTSFANPSGLDSPQKYSTARDIATMARFAMTMPEFREIVGTIETSFETNRATHDFTNTNILLQSYDGATGIKTGRTFGAGFSIVLSAERNDLELYAVVLGSGTDLGRFFNARYLLDFGFTHYRKKDLAIAGTAVGRAQITNFPDRSVQVSVRDDVTIPVLDIAGDIEQSIYIRDGRSPVRRGDEMGHITYIQNGRQIARVPLVSTQDVDNPFFLVQWYYNLVIALRGE